MKSMGNKFECVSFFENMKCHLELFLNKKVKDIKVSDWPRGLHNGGLVYEVTMNVGKEELRIYYPYPSKGIKEFVKMYYKSSGDKCSI